MPTLFKTHIAMTLVFFMGFAPLAVQAAPETCALDSWQRFLAPYDQNVTERELIETDGLVIKAFEFDALSGQYGKAFIFLLDGENCYTKIVSFGSYEMTNTVVKPEDLGPDGRIYHGDLYIAESHSTLGFYTLRPTYEQAREIAIEALK